jgi:phage anti-repressor protein
MTSLDIVNLITNNPITKLNANNNNKLLEKVKSNFTEMEQQLFIANFYTYLNYDKTADFIVDLDAIWQWLGFNKKFNGIRLLENFFVLNKDYKIFAPPCGGAKNTGRGGHNIQKFFLNIKTFKSLCLKAQTKKADEIHEYYIKLEELINEVLEEEALEMKNKLLIKDNLITNAIQDKLKAIEKTLVSQFPVNCECIYFGTIDNSNAEGEKLIKFGHSNNLSVRLQYHHKTYDNFILRDAFKVHNRQEIENAIKTSSKIRKHLRTIEVDGKNKNEILAYDETNFTIPCLSRYIKNIISEKSYSIEKFNILVEENQKYKAMLEQLSDENEKLKVLNNEYIEKNEKLEQVLASITNNYENINETINVNNDETNIISAELKNKFDKFIDECCFLHKDVDVASTTIVGQFRIYNREKPTKHVFSMFNTYMRTRFLACRISGQNKNQVVHGFKGIKLKDIVYKKSSSSNEVENFIFESCIFSPEGRASTNKIVEEFINYKKNNSLLINNNEDKDVKNYLKNCQYILGGPIRLHNINATFEGYYGISLKNDYYQEARDHQIATSGKKVQKIDASTKNILNNWTTIAKAAIHENFSPAKMSRAIKNNTLINNAYYVLVN